MAGQSLKHQNLILSLNQLQFEYFNSWDSFILIQFLIFEVVQKSKATVLTKKHRTKIDTSLCLFFLKSNCFHSLQRYFISTKELLIFWDKIKDSTYRIVNQKWRKKTPNTIPSLLAESIHIWISNSIMNPRMFANWLWSKCCSPSFYLGWKCSISEVKSVIQKIYMRIHGFYTWILAMFRCLCGD